MVKTLFDLKLLPHRAETHPPQPRATEEQECQLDPPIAIEPTVQPEIDNEQIKHIAGRNADIKDEGVAESIGQTSLHRRHRNGARGHREQ